jgi:hypothetical protein
MLDWRPSKNGIVVREPSKSHAVDTAPAEAQSSRNVKISLDTPSHSDIPVPVAMDPFGLRSKGFGHTTRTWQ